MRNILSIASIVLLGTSMAANADTLAGGAIFGGASQANAFCYLYNAGTGTVTVTSNAIVSQSSGALPLITDTCATLTAGSTCVIGANVANSNTAHSCRMVISPSGADIRGQMEIRNLNQSILTNIELR